MTGIHRHGRVVRALRVLAAILVSPIIILALAVAVIDALIHESGDDPEYELDCGWWG